MRIQTRLERLERERSPFPYQNWSDERLDQRIAEVRALLLAQGYSPEELTVERLLKESANVAHAH